MRDTCAKRNVNIERQIICETGIITDYRGCGNFCCLRSFLQCRHLKYYYENQPSFVQLRMLKYIRWTCIYWKLSWPKSNNLPSAKRNNKSCQIRDLAELSLYTTDYSLASFGRGFGNYFLFVDNKSPFPCIDLLLLFFLQ